MPPKRGTLEYEKWKNSPSYERFREKQRQAHKKVWQNKKLRENQRQNAKKHWQSEEYREKHRQAIQKAMESEELREKRSRVLRGLWQGQNSKIRQALKSKVVREKLSQLRKALWQDPDYVRKVLEALQQQTRPERIMEHLLDELFPGEYRYVGLGEVTLGGKIPDFINVNGQKKIIEVYGDYWHADDDPQERIDFFHRYGFNCLVIWESELQKVDSVVEKLVEFHGI